MKNFPSIAAALLMLLPRNPATYASYTLTPVILAINSRILIRICLIIPFLLLGILFNTERISLTAFVIELILVFPFAVGILGGTVSRRLVDINLLIRSLTLLTFSFSLYSLILKGFPLRLPYVHYAPDYYFALFGIGGAKIVTIIGFLGIFHEVFFVESGSKRRKLFILLSVSNLVAPNFLIGMICSAFAFSISAWRKKLVLIGLIFLLVVSYGYFSFRISTVNNTFSEVFGVHPKIYQFVAVWNLFNDNLMAFFVGVGLGQYSGEAALWASPISTTISSYSGISLPGFFAADQHLEYVAAPMLIFSSDSWVLSSSLNKPYGSVSTLLGEIGFPATAALIVLYCRTVLRRSAEWLPAAVYLAFFLSVMALDLQHDSPWFGLTIVCANSLVFGAGGKKRLP